MTPVFLPYLAMLLYPTSPSLSASKEMAVPVIFPEIFNPNTKLSHLQANDSKSDFLNPKPSLELQN